MRNLPLSGLAAAALVALGATPSAAFNGVFQGGGAISGFSPACVNVGWTRNADAYSVRFEPAGLGSSGADATLYFLSDYHAFGFSRPGGDFTTSWQTVDAAQLFSHPWFRGHAEGQATELRLTSIYPAVLDDTTARPVRIRGQVRHFGGVAWCRIDFDVIVQQRY